MNKIFSFFFITLLCYSHTALSGDNPLTVAFFDFSSGVGKASFKSLRASGIEHPCWHESFVEISGIETAYIEKLPKSLDPNDFRQALLGNAVAAERLRKSISAAGLNGAYAFTVEVSGKFGVIHGMGTQNIGIASSASTSITEGKLIQNSTFSKRLCEASKSME
ncbi:hypothetical protein ACFQNF_18005 [Iodobacter arcticus]|uniref:Uncharacterized protein n=1 Tax=Iodobacter arcticus TaxID=590593 RepID=A0ABW2R1E7_9NEIS